MAAEKGALFARPKFLVITGIITLVVALVVVFSVRSALTTSPVVKSEAPVATYSGAPGGVGSASAETQTPSPTQTIKSDSVCGLPGMVMEGRVTSAPEAQWEYGAMYFYPASPEYGPANTTADGVRMCFQHSPEGALFAAANMIDQINSDKVVAWIKYSVAEGKARDELLAHTIASPRPTYKITVRSNIEGFKILSYDGKKARVDLVVKSVGNGTVMYLSMILTLAWEKGDWKLYVENAERPADVVAIADASGYIPWGE